MPPSRKRSLVEADDTQFVRHATIKTSLSSIINSGRADLTGDPRPFLSEAILYCNKLRVLVSLVAKKHIFAELGRGPLTFEPDHNYYSRVKSVIVNGKLAGGPKRPAPEYAATLLAASDSVLRLAGIRCPVYAGKLKKTAVSNIMGYMLKQLAENLATHVDTHVHDCLRNWLNNEIRARLPPAEYVHPRHRGHIGRWRKRLGELAPDLEARFQELNVKLKTLRTTGAKVEFMFGLRRQVDQLETETGRAMKLFSVIPQASIGIAPIRIDSLIMGHIFKAIDPACRLTAAQLCSEQSTWNAAFNMTKISKLRRNATFGLSIQTDGVAAMVLVCSAAPLSTKPLTAREKRVRRTTDTSSGTSSTIPVRPGLVAIDPGVKSIITAVQLDDPTRPALQISQRGYQDGTFLNYKRRKIGAGSAVYLRDFKPIAAVMAGAPSRKSVARYAEHLAALASVWDEAWTAHSRQKLRKLKFFVWRRREAWMDRKVQSVRDYAGPDGAILFGDGADAGGFGKLRGGGIKGPVLELKRRLSKKVQTVTCSEFRTSKLCLTCGREARFYNHGVTYCSQQSHHRMENRDVAAAFKIGARWLAESAGADIGPWSRSIRTTEMETSTALWDALHNYQMAGQPRREIDTGSVQPPLPR